ncbi:MAG: transposase [Nanoarchaeota archaeon]|nr:transposase [Nanoarchaeota archaeon]
MNPKKEVNQELNKSSERTIPYQYIDFDKLFNKVYPKVKPAKKNKVKQEKKKLKKERISYSQDWEAYNQAQQKEKILLMKFLDELLDYIPFPEHKSVGRKPMSTRDKIFYLTLQAYNIKSSRRCIADLEIAKKLQFIEKAPHFNTVLKCLKDPSLITYFKHLINVSGLPLQQVETDFAVDSSGFSTSQFDRWFDARMGKIGRRRFRKCHLTCGVKTNIITAVNITRGYANDSPQFKSLVAETDKIFDIREISADKAYSSRNNLNAVSQVGGIAYIPFKKIVRKKTQMKGSCLWKKMYKYYTLNQEEFMEHYHKRSNSETVFHMLKTKFSKHLRSKDEIGQSNEILAKCLAHNICVLIQEMFELGININFQKCANIEIAHN